MLENYPSSDRKTQSQHKNISSSRHLGASISSTRVPMSRPGPFQNVSSTQQNTSCIDAFVWAYYDILKISAQRSLFLSLMMIIDTHVKDANRIWGDTGIVENWPVCGFALSGGNYRAGPLLQLHGSSVNCATHDARDKF
ncbi:hypothetical protein GQR58_004519 [Nymphon striatum]|nr:hypothetical protein GQR58_004519 [Nymphon striatum]